MPKLFPKKRARAFYLTSQWRQLRDAIVRKRGSVCQHCGKAGPVIADHVHEIRDGGAPLDERNIELMCNSCHTSKTWRARAERIRRSRRALHAQPTERT
jgi:5-methylcytosine-specific restriction endonuclease McrA